MKYALFYGSLKRHAGANGEAGFNFDRFGRGTQKYLKTVKLGGYNLYDLKWYPGLTKGKGAVLAELHEVEDRAFEGIQQMEFSANYSEEKVKNIPDFDNIEASIFFYEGNLEGKPLIKDGIWKQGE